MATLRSSTAQSAQDQTRVSVRRRSFRLGWGAMWPSQAWTTRQGPFTRRTTPTAPSRSSPSKIRSSRLEMTPGGCAGRVRLRPPPPAIPYLRSFSITPPQNLRHGLGSATRWVLTRAITEPADEVRLRTAPSPFSPNNDRRKNSSYSCSFGSRTARTMRGVVR